jgi:hypothetical protein
LRQAAGSEKSTPDPSAAVYLPSAEAALLSVLRFDGSSTLVVPNLPPGAGSLALAAAVLAAFFPLAAALAVVLVVVLAPAASASASASAFRAEYLVTALVRPVASIVGIVLGLDLAIPEQKSLPFLENQRRQQPSL